MRSLQPAAADITTAPVVSLLAISAVLGLAGLVAFRRRNLALPV
jgi:LPXTG-motif cell wall-anchored protein